MPSIRIWTPESNYDSKAVRCIAEKIIAFYGSDIKILEASKDAYNQAFQKNQKDGLQKQVNIYLKTSDLVIFLIDYDGVESHFKRRGEPNSLVNRITKVVNSNDKAILIYIKQELESWLLIDCLGICCYFTKDENTRIKKDWIDFSKKNQRGNTELIVEAIPGGKGAKEYLIKILSDRINFKINPILSKKLKEKRYEESDSPQVAKYIEINQQTLARNESLREFAKYLQDN
ncbi:MAG: hypothetical protein DCF12_02060 [Snowella sp.]|jgi:hypothetical protein|nr:MAG: hypothetical protein DCF12_02060 [Snowella sp.]